ncbi:MAG TPA: glycosyltransferase family 2 protein [Candidatus Woesebacteria bacterium]|nr:glycosyltransferase family 2 protein [Candidatus Woesebacteria bacterium]
MINQIAIITVVYNNYTVLQDFLTSLKNQKNKNFHLFIADASTKRKTITADGIQLTVLPIENLGYAHGVNVGIQEAIKMGINKFCVINDDVYFENNFVDTIENGFKEHNSNAFGAKIYYAPGYEFHKDRYTEKDKGKVIWYAGGAVDWNHALTHHIGVDEVDHGQFHTVTETQFITGCFMCFNKNIVDVVGLWDIAYFLYYEDSDYCERIKRNGFKLFFDPRIKLWHKNAQSTDGSGSKLHTNYQEKSRLRFGLKYAPFKTKLHLIKNYLVRRS